ncbi:MAG: XRE family transcriptional regulator [Acholeplasmatales bacterium]|nr:MAG: XRE family transcriptional regulator [Acholeplasmatales bacterium]
MYQTIDKNFALKVRMYRVEQGLSLRALADATSLSKSHLSDIERGLVPVHLDAVNTLKRVLQFNHRTTSRHVTAFKRTTSELHDMLISGDEAGAQALAATLEKHMITYTSGPLCLEYYLIMLMYALFTERKRIVIEPYFKRVEAVADLLEGSKKRWVLLLRMFYYLYLYDLKRTEQALAALRETTLSPLYEGFALYIEAMLHVYDYRRFTAALEIFDKAKAQFIGLNSFYFVMRIRVIEQRLHVYRQSFVIFWQLHEATESYAQIHGNSLLQRDNQGNVLRYHLINGDYTSMVELIETFDERQQIDQFLQIYALYRLGRHNDAQRLIHMVDITPESSFMIPLQQGIETLAHMIQTDADQLDLRRLVAFAESAYQASNYLMIRISHKILSEALQARRQYKEALYYGERLLTIMWAMTGGVR